MRSSTERARSTATTLARDGALRRRQTVSDADFVEAFALILARDDRAMLYGPDNDQTHGWRSIRDAARFAEILPGRAFFVKVAPDVFAGDWDAKDNPENVWTLHRELKAAG